MCPELCSCEELLARANVFVEHVGREIGATGPDDGSGLRVDAHPREAGRCPRPREHGTAHTVKHLDLANRSICEVSRSTPWRTTDAAVISGARPVIAEGLSRSARPRRGQHPQEVLGQLLAGVSILEPHEVAIGGIELAETELSLL